MFGRALGRFDALGEVRRGVLGRAADLAAEGLFGPGQDFLCPCRCCARRLLPIAAGEAAHCQHANERGGEEVLLVFRFHCRFLVGTVQRHGEYQTPDAKAQPASTRIVRVVRFMV